jgi:hypothetical protein
MTETPDYGLKKPAQEDFYDVSDFNANADIIDAALGGKADREEGKGLSSNDYTDAEKAKLGGVEEGATNTPLAQALGQAADRAVSQKAVTDALEGLSTGFLKLKCLTVSGGVAAIADYDPGEWQPNFILPYGADIPAPADPAQAAIAITEATDPATEATDAVDAYLWDVGGQAWAASAGNPMAVENGDLFSEYPSGEGWYWFGSRFNRLDFDIDPSAFAPASHVGDGVEGGQGVHGLRHSGGRLQVRDGAGWKDAGGGAAGVELSPEASKLLDGIKDVDGAVQALAGMMEASYGEKAFRLGDTLVQHGSQAGNLNGVVTVTFPEPFAEPPHVACSVRQPNPMFTYEHCINTLTAAGFSVYAYSSGTASSGYVDWIAVGKSAGHRDDGWPPKKHKVYGVSIDLANSNPESAVTYTDDAVGMSPGPAGGGACAWDTARIFRDIRPCVLKGGEVQYYLNPANFAQREDGTAADITGGDDGDVMIEIPKTGFQIATAGDVLTVRVTDDPDREGFRYYAHTRDGEGDCPFLYVGAYLGCSLSGKLRSLSGKAPAVNLAIGQFRPLAQANGEGYDLISFYPWTLLQCLYLIRFKSRDSQTALGRGFVNGSAAAATGGADAKGMNFGETAGTQQMKCLGVEDMTGNLAIYIDGIRYDTAQNVFAAFKGFNDAGTGYSDIGVVKPGIDIVSCMSRPQGTSETGFIMKEGDGSTTTYFPDRCAFRKGYTGPMTNEAAYNYTTDTLPWGWQGVFALHLSSVFTSKYATVGSRLMCLKPAEADEQI